MSKKNLSFQGIYKDFFKLKPKDMVIINRLLIYIIEGIIVSDEECVLVRSIHVKFKTHI